MTFGVLLGRQPLDFVWSDGQDFWLLADGGLDEILFGSSRGSLGISLLVLTFGIRTSQRQLLSMPQQIVIAEQLRIAAVLSDDRVD